MGSNEMKGKGTITSCMSWKKNGENTEKKKSSWNNIDGRTIEG